MQPPRNLLSTDLVHDAYVEALVNARLAALRSLVEIVSAGKDESEKRHAATTILKLPNPELPRRPLHTPLPIRYMDLMEARSTHGGKLPPRPTPFELAQAAANPNLLPPNIDPDFAGLPKFGLTTAEPRPHSAPSPTAALAAAAGAATSPMLNRSQ